MKDYIHITPETATLKFSLGKAYQLNPVDKESVLLEIRKKGSDCLLFKYPAHEMQLDDVIFFVDGKLIDLIYERADWYTGRLIVCDSCCGEHDIKASSECESSFIEQEEYKYKV